MTRPAAQGPRDLTEVVPGTRVETPDGTCYVVSREYPVTYRYGGGPLEEARSTAGATLAALARDEGLSGLTLDRACFLDTETTGLAGGTGTHVFLVGLGAFEGDFFRVEQFFMEDYDREPALLSALEERLQAFEAVVTFNGKAFDLPLIETRFILSRRRPPLRERPHLDLLAASRRLWGLRLESCRLAALEEAVLGESRVGDVPGWLVPQHYFAYLRTQDAWYLRPVFEHNRLDVLSLLALTGQAARRFESFLTRPPGEDDLDPLDLLALARLYRSVGFLEPAVRCYEACLGAGPAEEIDRVGLELIRLLRRLRRTHEAMAVATRLADGHPPRVWALVELSKDLEHRLRDYDRALAVVDRALGLLTEVPGSALPGGPARPSARPPVREDSLLPALEWRRDRLLRRRRGGRRVRAPRRPSEATCPEAMVIAPRPPE